jgi:hypothetical protein
LLLTVPAQHHATSLGGLQRGLGALADQAPLLLGQGGVGTR